MSITDLAIALGAGVVGFGIIWGLFNLIRQQKAPPLDVYRTEASPRVDRADKLSVADLGTRWSAILGVSATASAAEIEAAYHACVAECDAVRFSSSASSGDRQAAESRRAQINDAYEFIRTVKG